MSDVSVEVLFDEYATRYLRGEQPDASEYLERATEGTERDDLADLLDRFLEAVPARAPREEEIVLMEARLEKEPPLLVLRRRRKLGRRAVVDALVGRLGLDSAKRDKVAGYYHDLEIGNLDPEPVSSQVWGVLGELLRANARSLAGLRGAEPPPTVAAAYHRGPAILYSLEVVAPAPSDEEAADEPDEIDRLFTGSA